MYTAKKLALMAITGTTLAVCSQMVAAGSSSTLTMGVSAEVKANCIISGTPSISVASYDPIGTNKTADLDDSTSFSLTCTNGTTAATVRIDGGLYVNSGTRRLENGSDDTQHLTYNVYTDSGRTTAWGVGSTNPLSLPSGSYVLDGTAQTINVYVRIPQDQQVKIGTYTDSLSIQAFF